MNIQDFKTVNELIEKQKVEIAKLRQELKESKDIIERVRNFCRKVT